MDKVAAQVILVALGVATLVTAALAPAGQATYALISAGSLLIGMAIPTPGKVQ